MKKARYSSLLMLALVAALVGSLCSKDGSVDGGKAAPASRTVLTFWDENAGPSRTPYYLELFRRFEELHPDLKVQYVGIPVSLNKTKYDTAISANSLPDVAAVNADWIADFAAKGVLLPLDRFFKNWPERNEIGSSFIEYNRSLVPDGKLYQIPNTFYFDVLWYRSDWFQAAGISGLGSWNDFFAAADKLTVPEENRSGYSLRGADGSITQLTSLLYAYSGITRYFTEDGKCTVNDPLHIEFLKRYMMLYGRNTPISDIANGYKEMVAAFDSGRTAMIQHNFGSFQDHLQALGNNKFNATLLPPSLQGNRVMVTAANGYGIFNTTRHPDAAWELVGFLLSEESQTYWNSKVGQMPTHVKAWDSDYVKSTPFLQVALAALNDKRTGSLRPPVYLPDYSNLLKQQLEPNFQNSPKVGFPIIIGIFAVLGVLSFYVTYRNTKEVIVQESPKEKHSFKSVFKTIGSNKPLLAIGLMTIFSISAYNIKSAVMIYYAQYTLGNVNLVSTLNFITIGCSVIGLLMMPKLAKRFGNKQTMIIGFAISIVCDTVNFLMPNNIVVFTILASLAFFGISIVNAVTWALVNDVIDYGEWRTGKRTEGIIFSSYNFFRKIAQSLSGFASGIGLSLIGYVPNAHQSAHTLTGIKGLLLLYPAVALVIAIIIFSTLYKLNEKRTKQIVTELKQRETPVHA